MRWKEFEQRYRVELKEHAGLLAELQEETRRKTVTFVFSAHDPDHNNAVALRKALLGRSTG